MPHRRPAAIVLILLPALALLAAALDMPARWDDVGRNLPLLALWTQPEAQYRLQVGAAPYDFLQAANKQLPANAAVLLVTSGSDPRHDEYTLYHRALYFLAPRPVWWLTPAAPDGTWESRWWISAPLDAATIKRIAAEKGVNYVLAYGTAQQQALGRAIVLPGGSLTALDATTVGSSAAPPPEDVSLLGVALGLTLLFALGSALVRLLVCFGHRASWLEALSLAWIFGAGAISTGLFWLNALGFNLMIQVLLLGAGCIMALLFALRLPRITPAATTSNPAPKPITFYVLRFALLLLLAAQTAIVALLAAGRHLQVWDSWVNWGMKSRSIFLAGAISPAAYADPARAVTHLDYPLLVPLTQTWLYSWAGTPDDRLAGLVSLLFYLALLGVVYSGLRALGAGGSWALAGAALVGTLWHLAGLAEIVFADLPLALLATVAGVNLARWLAGGAAGTLLVAALAAGLLGWTKREGVVLLIAFVCAALLCGPRNRRSWQAAGALLLAGAVLAGPWYVFSAAQGITSPDFAAPSLALLADNLSRGPTIGRLELRSLIGSGFGFIWPAGVVALALGALRHHALLPFAAVIYVLLMACAYFFSTYVPFEQHILSSVDRIGAHVAPLVAIWLILTAQRAWRQLQA